MSFVRQALFVVSWQYAENIYIMRNLAGDGCSCPAPLVVPENANDPVLFGCCAETCVGSMYTEDEQYHMQRAQLYFSVIGFIMSLFIVVTWLTFKKRESSA